MRWKQIFGVRIPVDNLRGSHLDKNIQVPTAREEGACIRRASRKAPSLRVKSRRKNHVASGSEYSSATGIQGIAR